MASEALLSTIVQIGITGAGLVLAIYALVIPLSRRMFGYRAQLLFKQTKLFDKQRAKLTPEAATKEFKQLQNLAESIKENRRLPKYLTVDVLLTFVLYIFLATIHPKTT